MLSIDEYAEEVRFSAEMDSIRWPITENRNSAFNLTGDTPEENIEYLKEYITARKRFLDEQWIKNSESE